MSGAYWGLSTIKFEHCVWMTTPAVRNCCHSHVCFADASLGWGCTCAVSLQLSETMARFKHATVSCFRVLPELMLGFSKLGYGLIQVFEFWIWHLHAHKNRLLKKNPDQNQDIQVQVNALYSNSKVLSGWIEFCLKANNVNMALRGVVINLNDDQWFSFMSSSGSLKVLLCGYSERWSGYR